MSSNGTTNSGKIWTIAAIVGVIAFFVLIWWVAYAFWPALLLAVLIAILVAILLWIGFYRDSDDGGLGTAAGLGGAAALGAAGVASAASRTADGAASAANLTGSTAKAPAPKPAAKPAAKPAKAKAAATQKKPAKRKPAAKKPAARKPAAKKRATGARTAASMMGDAGNAMAAEKKAAKAKPARKAVAKDGKPELLKKARAGGADDLKQIKGVGPKLEGMLNKMGIYHFDQVSSWRSKEVSWVDDHIEGFNGRVSRDGWVKQAKTLAKGGATEFSKRVQKGGVYKKK